MTFLGKQPVYIGFTVFSSSILGCGFLINEYGVQLNDEPNTCHLLKNLTYASPI